MHPLAAHYSRFRVADRLLFTGHSHQAWPDVAFDAHQRAWLDAAELVDDKWERAMDVAARVRAHWTRLLADDQGEIALGQNTHELVTRLLSALPLAERSMLVTSDGEFHTIRRQLARLGEEALDIAIVPARPAEELADRLAARVCDRTACVVVSSVLYETAEIVPGLDRLAARCELHGATLLVDAYHHLNAVPFHVRDMGLDRAYVTGGGYKYCQLGEGNCFLRVPPGTRARPVLTGWFAEFEHLEETDGRGRVEYAAGGGAFMGATYDPTAHYRAEAVFDFHVSQGLTPERLGEISRHQVGLLMREFERLDAPPAIAHVEPMPDDRRAGFLAIRAPKARALCHALRQRGVMTDYRGDVLRIGPAPYVSDTQIRNAIAHLGEILKGS